MQRDLLDVVPVMQPQEFSTQLTVKGQVSKESSQQVHDEHGEEGDVGDALHLSAGAAV